MKTLIRKELITILSSGIGLFFAFIFLLTNGLMLWYFEGSFNILDIGYANLDKFFSLSSILLLLLIPALTMRLISEEKRTHTLEILRSRPVSISQIIFSKWISTLIFVATVILSTVVYIYTIYVLGASTGNVDFRVIILSYLSLIFLSSIFIGIGVLASSISGNQFVAFVIALFCNLVFYFGFDLLAGIFQTGSTQALITSFGLLYHFSEMQRGIITIGNVWVFANYTFIIFFAAISILSLKNRIVKKQLLIYAVSLLVLNIIMIFIPNIQQDFTTDKRYTISDYSKQLVANLVKNNSSKVKVNVYLEGNLNYGFQRLKNATNQFLRDLNGYADHNIDVSFIDPLSLNISREDIALYMTNQAIPPILLNEVDREGKLSKQFIYPYAQVIIDQDTLPVSLLKNIKGNTAEENLNASIVDLEFQFVDALRLLIRKEPQEIAFIEGHGELARPYVYDAEVALSKYFFVNRGQIGNDLSILDGFKVIVIAGPTQKYSETEKYILDQYLMKGGRILWLIDGAYVSLDDLANKGQSASMKNETNLDDLLFTYGIRVESDLLQDSQSTKILVQAEVESQPVNIPWYFSPLLLPSLDNVITKDIAEVKAAFVSSISLLNKSNSISKKVLLSTSQRSRIIPVPEMITFDVEQIQSDADYFKDSFLPVSVALEGKFKSAFNNRLVPDSLRQKKHKTQMESIPTKMIVVSSSDIIKNDIIGQGEDSEVLPMGYDRISRQKYGNKDFIVNAVNWLANDDGWMELRSKTHQLNLLDKKLVVENRTKYAILNVLFPLCFIGIILGGVTLWRRYKYTR